MMHLMAVMAMATVGVSVCASSFSAFSLDVTIPVLANFPLMLTMK